MCPKRESITVGRFTAGLTLLISLAACSTGTGPDARTDPRVEVELRVEDSLAEVGPAPSLSEGWISLPLSVTVRNKGAFPVLYRRYGSGPNFVERREGDRWHEVWQSLVSYGSPVDVEITAGEAYSVEFLVRVRLGSMPGEWPAPVGGEYRIGIAISAVDRVPGTTHNMIQYSEPFRVEVR